MPILRSASYASPVKAGVLPQEQQNDAPPVGPICQRAKMIELTNLADQSCMIAGRASGETVRTALDAG